MGSTILSTGHYAPVRRVGNAEIEARLGLEDGWILRRTGIAERRYAAADEALFRFVPPQGASATRFIPYGATTTETAGSKP